MGPEVQVYSQGNHDLHADRQTKTMLTNAIMQPSVADERKTRWPAAFYYFVYQTVS
jgi:hypothetical protein